MKTFICLIIYVFIGGFFTANFQNHIVENCQRDSTTEEMMYITFGWPAVFSIAITQPDFIPNSCE